MGGESHVLRALLEMANNARSNLTEFARRYNLRAQPSVSRVFHNVEHNNRRFRPHSDHYWRGNSSHFEAGKRHFHHQTDYKWRGHCRMDFGRKFSRRFGARFNFHRGFSSSGQFFRQKHWMRAPFWHSNFNLQSKISLKSTIGRTGLNIFLRERNTDACLDKDFRPTLIGHARLSGKSFMLTANASPAESFKQLWVRPVSPFAQAKNFSTCNTGTHFYSGSYSLFSPQKEQRDWVSRQLHTLPAFAIPQDSATLQEIRALESDAANHPPPFFDEEQSLEHLGAPVETSVVDFDFKPHFSMASVGELTQDVVEDIATDVESFIQHLRDKMEDLKRMSSLGELPISVENGVVKVHFPNADSSKVHTLLSDVEVTTGVVADTTPASTPLTLSSSSSVSSGSMTDSDDFLLSGSIISSEGYEDGLWTEERAPALTNATSEYLESEILLDFPNMS